MVSFSEATGTALCTLQCYLSHCPPSSCNWDSQWGNQGTRVNHLPKFMQPARRVGGSNALPGRIPCFLFQYLSFSPITPFYWNKGFWRSPCLRTFLTLKQQGKAATIGSVGTWQHHRGHNRNCTGSICVKRQKPVMGRGGWQHSN